MKSWSLVVLLAAFPGGALAPPADGPWPDADLHQGKLSFDGKSSLGDFTGVTSTLRGHMTGGATLVDVRGWVEAPVATLKTGNDRRDRDLVKTMDAAIYPNIRFEITSISSTGNTVRANNADNGGDGVTQSAIYDYSQLVGADFIANEETGNKTLKFNNANTVMFTFTARVMANVATGSGGGPGGTGGAAPTGTTGGTSGTSGTGVTGTGGTHLLKFTVNPLTKLVTIQSL